jgi:hypothetical protein
VVQHLDGADGHGSTDAAGGPDAGRHRRVVSQRVRRVDLAACRAYAKAVYAQSEAFIAAADDATLLGEVHTPMGAMPLAVAFEALVIGHCNQLAGEISAIKGAFGLRGYPF